MCLFSAIWPIYDINYKLFVIKLDFHYLAFKHWQTPAVNVMEMDTITINIQKTTQIIPDKIIPDLLPLIKQGNNYNFDS